MKNFNNRYFCKNIHRYFTDISNIFVKSNYRYIRVYRYFDPWCRERSSGLSLRSTKFGWSSRIGLRLKVGVLVEGNAWTPKSRVFVRDTGGKFGMPWVSSFRVFEKLRLRSKRQGTFLLGFIFHLGVVLILVEPYGLFRWCSRAPKGRKKIDFFF